MLHSQNWFAQHMSECNKTPYISTLDAMLKKLTIGRYLSKVFKYTAVSSTL